MSEIQETDKAMRIIAIIGGFIALVESLLVLINLRLLSYGEFFGIWSGILGIIFAILAIFLGIKPIQYTPVFLGILGIGLIVFGILIGGIFVLLAALLGALT
ncbi:MAG: hypothetical protein ACFFCI_18690 [Promethearchaeota archaeon]